MNEMGIEEKVKGVIRKKIGVNIERERVESR